MIPPHALFGVRETLKWRAPRPPGYQMAKNSGEGVVIPTTRRSAEQKILAHMSRVELNNTKDHCRRLYGRGANLNVTLQLPQNNLCTKCLLIAKEPPSHCAKGKRAVVKCSFMVNVALCLVNTSLSHAAVHTPNLAFLEILVPPWRCMPAN